MLYWSSDQALNGFKKDLADNIGQNEQEENGIDALNFGLLILIELVPNLPLIYALLKRIASQIDFFDIREEANGLVNYLLEIPNEFGRELLWSRRHPFASRLIRDLHEIIHGGHRGPIAENNLEQGPGLTLCEFPHHYKNLKFYQGGIYDQKLYWIYLFFLHITFQTESRHIYTTISEIST